MEYRVKTKFRVAGGGWECREEMGDVKEGLTSHVGPLHLVGLPPRTVLRYLAN